MIIYSICQNIGLLLLVFIGNVQIDQDTDIKFTMKRWKAQGVENDATGCEGHKQAQRTIVGASGHKRFEQVQRAWAGASRCKWHKQAQRTIDGASEDKRYEQVQRAWAGASRCKGSEQAQAHTKGKSPTLPWATIQFHEHHWLYTNVGKYLHSVIA